MKRDPLLDLATAIADGTSIDWAEAGRQTPAVDARALQAARVVERLATLHTPDDPDGASSASVLPTLGPAVDAAAGSPVVWGPLTIDARIGRGSFGDVYRARDSRLDRPVALKLSRRRDPHATALVEEGRLLARVRHPNVVTVYGAERIDGRAGLWMEFVDGRTLTEELAARGPLAAREVMRIGADLADALEAVHQAGLLHRDVKAQNVMRAPDGRVVLMDFGTGQEWGPDVEAPPELAGTPLYLAPEVLEGGPATVASDIYSLGVLLHVLTTGRFPVSGRSIRDLRDAHALATGPVMTPQARAQMPARLASAVARALAKDPQHRFGRAADLAGALAPRRIGAGWRLGGAVAAGVAIAAAGMVWLRPPPSEGGPGPGILVEHLARDLQASTAFVGPARGAIIPCAPRDLPAAVAMCDWRSERVEATLRKSILATGDGGPQFAVTSVVLSPDGSNVAYTWSRGREERRSLNLIDAVSGESTELLDNVDVRVGRWTTDGRSLVVHELSGERRDLMVPVDGSAPTTLFSRRPDDEAGDLSPDGRMLAIARPGENQDLDVVVIDVATGGVRWRFPNPGPDHGPIWTPGGESLVFVNDGPGSHDLMEVSVTEGGFGQARLIHRAGRSLVTLLGFGPDGWLYFSSMPPSRTAYVADLDAERLAVDHVQVVDPRTVESTTGPDWSADGRLAYVRGPQDASAPLSVVIGRMSAARQEIPLDRRYPHPIAPSLHGLQPSADAVRWSPNGRQLAIVSAVDETPAAASAIDLLTIGDELPAPSHVLTTARVDNLRWDPSGTALWYLDALSSGAASGLRVLMRHDPGTNETREFFRPSGCGAVKAMDVSRQSGDVAMLLFCSPRWSVKRLSDEEVWELPADWRECLAIAWVGETPGVLISVYRTGSARGELWHLDTSTGERSQIALDTDFIFDLSVSADGRRLSYTAGSPLAQVYRVSGVTGTR